MLFGGPVLQINPQEIESNTRFRLGRLLCLYSILLVLTIIGLILSIVLRKTNNNYDMFVLYVITSVIVILYCPFGLKICNDVRKTSNFNKLRNCFLIKYYTTIYHYYLSFIIYHLLVNRITCPIISVAYLLSVLLSFIASVSELEKP